MTARFVPRAPLLCDSSEIKRTLWRFETGGVRLRCKPRATVCHPSGMIVAHERPVVNFLAGGRSVSVSRLLAVSLSCHPALFLTSRL